MAIFEGKSMCVITDAIAFCDISLSGKNRMTCLYALVQFTHQTKNILHVDMSHAMYNVDEYHCAFIKLSCCIEN